MLRSASAMRLRVLSLFAALAGAVVLIGCETASQPFSRPDVVIAPPRTNLGNAADEPYFTPTQPGPTVHYYP